MPIMYSFEGNYRRTPLQSHSGASHVANRADLLLHARQQREAREEHRKRTKSTLVIQSFVRSFITRVKTKRSQRAQFDAILLVCSKAKTVDVGHLTGAAKKLLFFYWHAEDGQRLAQLSHFILREHQRILPLTSSKSDPWFWHIRRLLSLNVDWLVANPDNATVPLRLLEIFTSVDPLAKSLGPERSKVLVASVLEHLIVRGYLEKIRRVLDLRTPPLIESSSKPPTFLMGSLFDLLSRPLKMVGVIPAAEFRIILQQLCKDVLSPRQSEVVRLFVIPALAELPLFPFKELLISIRDLESDQHTAGLLLAVLKIERPHFVANSKTNLGDLIYYLQVLASLTNNLRLLAPVLSSSDDDEDGDENEDDYVQNEEKRKEDKMIMEECVSLLNDEIRVQALLTAIEETNEILVLNALCQVCHNLLLSSNQAVHKCRLLYMLAFKPSFLHHLWAAVAAVSQTSVFGYSTPLVQLIARGVVLSLDETHKIVPLLAVFCALFSVLLATLHDSEFYGEESGIAIQKIPFTLPELVGMSRLLKDVSLGLVDLAYPESRTALLDIDGIETQTASQEQTQLWSHLFKVVVKLVRMLHSRDNHRSFCPEGHWVSNQVQGILVHCQPSELAGRRRRLRGYRPFQGLRAFTREEMEVEGPPLTTKEVRTATVLHELPFLVPFEERVVVFQTIVLKDKMEHQGEAAAFLLGPSIQITVRRDYLYEDAFDRLSPDNEPELRLKMRVQLVNKAGLGEAGVDGGGLFREFLTELLKTAFDPNRGFFKLTKDNLLYPNPNVQFIVEDFSQHYFFIGRVLGKALYENLLVELPLAQFFLQKLVTKSSDVDIHHLASLDPLMYRNLLFLKNYDGDVLDLGLDFTILMEELGERRVDELKPGGASIPVTSGNRIEYIHLVADYKLNRQIRQQCAAFRAGLTRVIPLEWIQMFNSKELQVLIAGAEVPVDVEDLRTHTDYAGGYTAEHPTIRIFWNVVANFSDIQKRSLLKFVTSCSRPPLLGFKELDPPFCVQPAGTSDRLPTASTCMNLLKLPEFTEEKLMSEKLAYAIQAGAGFELS